MIHVTRLNQEELIVNADLLEFIEKTPDTMLTLTTGKKLMVRQTPEEIIELVLDYRRKAGPLLVRPDRGPSRDAANHGERFGEAMRHEHGFEAA